MVSKVIVNKVIHLASNRKNSERLFMSKYYPNGVSMASTSKYNNTSEYQQYKADEKDLDDYLESLEYDDIKDLQTLMYLGREDENNFVEMRRSLDLRGWNRDKRIEAYQMVEKLPLDEYLTTGIEIYGM